MYPACESQISTLVEKKVCLVSHQSSGTLWARHCAIAGGKGRHNAIQQAAIQPQIRQIIAEGRGKAEDGSKFLYVE